DLALTSERNGFINSAVEVEEVSELEGSLPCIALRKNHYVVIYKVLKDDLIVGDPATGVLKISIDEFEEGFQNFALLMKPTEAFDSLPIQKTKYWHFVSLLGEVKAELVISFFISLLMIALGLSGPLLSQIFFDDVLVRKDLNWMWITFAIGIFVAICESSLSWAKTYYDNYVSVKIDFKMNSILLKKVIDLPYTEHTKRHSGDFMMRFEELGTIKSFLLHTSEDLVLSICSVVVYSLVLFVYAPVVAIFAFASLPLFALISWLAGKRLVRIDQKVFRESAEAESSLMDTIKGIAAIKSLGGELAARWRYEEKLVSLLKTERQYELTAESINIVFNIYYSFVKYSIFAICIYLSILG
ncbi:MAG: ABC transporter transmembrane domain-containing protein, partial [Pseudomonadota bacterium]